MYDEISSNFCPIKFIGYFIMSAQAHPKAHSEAIVIEMNSQQPSCCPSCHNTSSFTYLGKQVWPQRVAQKLNVPQISTLWRCDICHTTITKT